MEKQDMDTDTDTGHGHGRRSAVEKRSTIDFIDDHYPLNGSRLVIVWSSILHSCTGEELKNDPTFIHST